MLALSNLRIKLKPSKDFNKLRKALAGLTIIIFSQSLFITNIVAFLLVGLTTLILIILYKGQFSEETIDQIEHNKNGWVLRDYKNRSYKFERLELSFDSGFFTVITFTSLYSKKKLILFHDQITESQLKQIRIIHKIT
ncbi:hypothetical protein [Legionella yabuuchiae]|uniref:hypothetical protein n=1 Tax=Legionella yabuuchiae TaxID=376727 RepID=UPI00105476FC|nr:hypothetical protein [Legionella yabuuchiae]